jgi:hypothetical protein
MSTIDYYTDDAERTYLISHVYQTPYFAPGELSKIENYAQALANNFVGWVIHHRLELNPDGSVNKRRDELILSNQYYYRPANELIFLTSIEHGKLHGHSIKPNPTIVSHETRNKQSNAKLVANNTEERYRVVSALVESGELLCMSDYQFYRRYCQRNGIAFTGAKVDKSHTVSRVDVPKVNVTKNKQSRTERTEARYKDVMERLNNGDVLPMKEFSFLRRYCDRRLIDVPSIIIVDDGFKLKNISGV